MPARSEALRLAQADRVRRGLPAGDRRHGTPGGYAGWGCRCDGCRAWAREYHKRYYKAKPSVERACEQCGVRFTPEGAKARFCSDRCRWDAQLERYHTERAELVRQGLPVEDRRHGTRNGYTNWACRCGLCLAAERRYQRSKVPKRALKRCRTCGGPWGGKCARVGAKGKAQLCEYAKRAIWTAQGGYCAACQLPMAWDEITIDHDHGCCSEAGKSCGRCITGLVHERCNAAMGCAGDDADRLADLSKYARRTRQPAGREGR